MACFCYGYTSERGQRINKEKKKKSTFSCNVQSVRIQVPMTDLTRLEIALPGRVVYNHTAQMKANYLTSIKIEPLTQ